MIIDTFSPVTDIFMIFCISGQQLWVVWSSCPHICANGQSTPTVCSPRTSLCHLLQTTGSHRRTLSDSGSTRANTREQKLLPSPFRKVMSQIYLQEAWTSMAFRWQRMSTPPVQFENQRPSRVDTANSVVHKSDAASFNQDTANGQSLTTTV